MPIAFPPLPRGNPFDRWVWQWGAVRLPVAPNLARPGRLFTRDTLGGSQFARKPTNMRQLGAPYMNVANTSCVNPASELRAATSVQDAERRVYRRLGGILRATVSGIVRDSVGAIVPNARVMRFRTTDNMFIDETLSDALGAYTLEMLVGGPFYLVTYLAGAPDVAGTSVNTLVPVVVP